MDPLSRLPAECLHLVIKALIQKDDEQEKRGDLSALFPLLQTNKYIANTILPHLYSNPFRSVSRPWSVQSLCRTLLSQTNTASPPEILALAFDLAPDNGQRPTMLNYLAHIRHLDLDQSDYGNDDQVWLGYQRDYAEEQYIHSQSFKDLCRWNSLAEDFVYMHGKEVLLDYLYWIVLKRETAWEIAVPIFEQLQSMVIPISLIRRYHRVINRLGALERVRFSLDEIFDYGQWANEQIPIRIYWNTQRRKEKAMQGLIKFVQDHTRLFPGRLKSATCFSNHKSPIIEQEVPKEIELGLARCFPAPDRPTHLHRGNWLLFLAHLESVDLSHVQSISTEGLLLRWFNMARDKRQFLQRCRNLELFDMQSLGHDSFRWAVQEKRDMERHNSNIQSGQGSALQNGSRPAYMDHGLVPLEAAVIREHNTNSLEEIDDVVFAFRNTLRTLQVEASEDCNYSQESMYIGRGWVSLPVLTLLHLDGMDTCLVVDRGLLSLCPNLFHLELSDRTQKYQVQDIVPCHAARLENLESIVLQGWSALTFHPETLRSTPKLKILDVSMATAFILTYIPSPELLDWSFGIQGIPKDGGVTTLQPMGPTIVRPRWTWDWDLPLLEELTLSAEFAYLFEFRMLQGCPALQVLKLHLYSFTHHRAISEEDLFMPKINNRNNNNNNSKDVALSTLRERIVAPALWRLSLIGKWEIDETVLPAFLTGMFPNLQELTDMGCDKYKLADIVGVVRSAPNRIKKIHLRVEAGTGETERLGIYLQNEVPSQETVLPIELTLGGPVANRLQYAIVAR